jgi:hypothetical protein
VPGYTENPLRGKPAGTALPFVVVNKPIFFYKRRNLGAERHLRPINGYR